MKSVWIIVISLLLIVIVACFSFKSFMYENLDPVNSDSRPVDHSLWDELLNTYVNQSGLIDYHRLKENSTQFEEYLAILENNHPNDKYWKRDQKMAYWINAYNAFTVKLIIDNYPVESIKDIKTGIPFINSVWDIKFITIEGANYDLNNIEHDILRKRYQDPRIHFAISCASLSCPGLKQEAYISQQLDRQLNQAGKEFLADTTKNVIGNTQVRISKIFSWYKSDFTPDGTLINFLNQYSPVQINEDAEIDYMDYDWGLNDLQKAQQSPKSSGEN